MRGCARIAFAVALVAGTSVRAEAPVQPPAAPYRVEAERIMKLVDDAKVEAVVDWAYGPGTILGRYGEKTEVDARHRRQELTALLASAGPVLGHALAVERNLADRFVALDYLILGERRPLQIGFVFYRPASEWLLYSWSYGHDAHELFGDKKR